MPSPAGSFLSPERLRRARLGAALLFLVNGAVFSNLLPRLPQIKDAFELSNSVYGFVVIAFPLGSLLAGTAPAPIMRRWGSGRTAVMGSVAIALMILLAGVSGGIGGGLMGTAALALQVPLAVHLAISGILFSAVAVFAGTRVLTMEEVARVRPLAESSAQQDALPADGPEPAQDLPGLSEQDAPGVAAAAHEPSSGAASAATASPGSAGPARRAVLMLLLISVVSITGVMVEDLGQNWSALYLSQVLEASATMAGLGLVALMSAQFIGRLLGDRMVDRLGHVTMARLGAVGIAAGLGLVVAAPAPAAAVAGFFLAGLGSATLVPSAYHAADLVPGLRPGTGLAVVSWLMRGAFLSLSPFVGVVSDALGLRLAFLVIPVAAVLAVLTAGHLRQPART